MDPKKRDEALERAITAAGGTAALARFITENSPDPISTQAISQWVTCPASRVLVVEKATVDETGKPRVTRHELRDDIYPVEQAA